MQGTCLMNATERNTRLILEIFRRIEERDPLRPNPASVLELFQHDIQFHWPPSLPFSAPGGGAHRRSTWEEVWSPLQPTPTERKMDPRVVAAGDEEVVVLWRQRGLSPTGERYEGEVLGLYGLRDGKLARAKMFYFDPVGAAAFLARATTSVRSSD